MTGPQRSRTRLLVQQLSMQCIRDVPGIQGVGCTINPASQSNIHQHFDMKHPRSINETVNPERSRATAICTTIESCNTMSVRSYHQCKHSARKLFTRENLHNIGKRTRKPTLILAKTYSKASSHSQIKLPQWKLASCKSAKPPPTTLASTPAT